MALARVHAIALALFGAPASLGAMYMLGAALSVLNHALVTSRLARLAPPQGQAQRAGLLWAPARRLLAQASAQA